MKLLRPNKYVFPNNVLLMRYIYYYQVPNYDMPFSRTLHILFAGNDSGTVFNNIALPPHNTHVESYFKFRNQLNVSINNAEALQRLLRSFLLYLHKDRGREFIDRLRNFTFSQLRDEFSIYLKSFEPLKRIEQFSTNAKIKNVTRMFSHFIEDRNIYTHCQLVMFFPEEDSLGIFLMEHNESRTFSQVSFENLLSYNEAFMQLSNFLNMIGLLRSPNPVVY